MNEQPPPSPTPTPGDFVVFLWLAVVSCVVLCGEFLLVMGALLALFACAVFDTEALR